MVVFPDKVDLSPPLRDIPAVAAPRSEEILNRFNEFDAGIPEIAFEGPHAGLQASNGPTSMPTPAVSSAGVGNLNDYRKFGLWPDGYYQTANQFSCNIITRSSRGAGVVAFERSKMLTGQTAQAIYYNLHSVNSSYVAPLPAGWEGTTRPPPSGSPDSLRLWNLHVDWTTPSNSTRSRSCPAGLAASHALQPGALAAGQGETRAARLSRRHASGSRAAAEADCPKPVQWPTAASAPSQNAGTIRDPPCSNALVCLFWALLVHSPRSITAHGRAG